MYTREELLKKYVGRTEFNLTVTGVERRGDSWYLICFCKCGKENVYIRKDQLGRIKSCGCLSRDKARDNARILQEKRRSGELQYSSSGLNRGELVSKYIGKRYGRLVVKDVVRKGRS